jgi:UDP-N-acetylmuramoylalanine--D-glutamate ligase
MIQKKKAKKLSPSGLFDHRFEPLGEINGISFINDSGSIRVGDTWTTLHGLECGKNVIWIMGGSDSGIDYGVLESLVYAKVKGIVCLSHDSGRIQRRFQRESPFFVKALSVEEAVGCALAYGSSGDIALLSPACPGFDLVDNFRGRGEEFRAAFVNFYNNLP